MPLAWSLTAAPAALETGIAADFGMVVAAVIATGLIIWRDRTSTWPTVTAGLLLTVMIAWSGHDVELIGAALVLVIVTLTQNHRDAAADHHRPPTGTSPGRAHPVRIGS